MKTQTPRQIAKLITERFRSKFIRMATDSLELRNVVEAEIRNRDEWAAGVADKEAQEWRQSADNYKPTDPMRATCIARAEMAQEIAATIRCQARD